LRQRLDDEQAALSGHAERLMRLGDEAGHRLGNVTRELAAGSETLSRHAAALDRAAESARTDIGVLLEDLPRAEASSRAMGEELRQSGREASAQAASLEAQLAAISGRAREAEDQVGGAAQRLVAHLTQIESAGAAAAMRVGESGTSASAQVDTLLERTGEALGLIRSGIDEQAAAVRALVDQSAAALGVAGQEAALQLGSRLSTAGQALDGLAARVAEQDRAVTALVAGLERQLAEVDQRFVDLAAEGDMRAQAVAGAIDRVRRELDGLGAQQAASGGTLEDLSTRTEHLRNAVAALQRECGEELTGALGQAEGGAERLLAAVQAARPDVEWMSEATAGVTARLEQGTAGLAGQQERLVGLLASVETGVGGAEQRLAELRAALSAAGEDAARLQAETGPALVQAMVQVREAASQAATRAREALAAVVPETAQQLSVEARAALSRAVEESVKAQLGEVERVAARALEAARHASAGLSQQMLNIGRTATALEQHIEKVRDDDRMAESEVFARRAAVLIDSLHSASIDVGRILSDEVDDRAWASYLKGDRGVFTRKAVRLLSAGELRLVDQQFGSDPEFASSVTRYVNDFETMLRRASAEQEGGMMAVTLLSSDMGRLYTALAQVLERRR
jgi:DNA repair exonuclease SbcCD ATPase subunit